MKIAYQPPLVFSVLIVYSNHWSVSVYCCITISSDLNGQPIRKKCYEIWIDFYVLT